MPKTAIFPGRFQPPHLGHIYILMKIYPLYDEIIIAVTSYTYGGKTKQVLPIPKIVQLLQDLFKHLPKIRVIAIGKGMIERETFDDLPHFDVVATGNMELVRKMEKLGIKTRWHPRIKIPGWRGAEQRHLFRNE